jgi:hypothetical protein
MWTLDTITDESFDDRIPLRWRQHALLYFTPVHVARRAAQLLVDKPGQCILDVGAGVGKFCIVGAAALPEGVFVGIERRRPLVRVAERLALEYEVRNVAFLHGDATEIDWSAFDAFYFYNPFAEYLRTTTPLDDSLELDPESFRFYVRWVSSRLAVARVGTRVVTYHGFGGVPPRGYVLRASELIGTDRLELWIKEAEHVVRTR